MMLRSARFLGSLVAGALLSSCAVPGEITAVEPLVGAVPIAVSLQTTAGIPLAGLPRLEVSGRIGEASVVWEVESGSCLMASATAARAGNVVEVRLQRDLNPLANCVAARVGYRYAVRIPALAPGQYEVRLVDAYVQTTPNEIGRSSIVVLLYGLD